MIPCAIYTGAALFLIAWGCFAAVELPSPGGRTIARVYGLTAAGLLVTAVASLWHGG